MKETSKSKKYEGGVNKGRISNKLKKKINKLIPNGKGVFVVTKKKIITTKIIVDLTSEDQKYYQQFKENEFEVLDFDRISYRKKAGVYSLIFEELNMNTKYSDVFFTFDEIHVLVDELLTELLLSKKHDESDGDTHDFYEHCGRRCMVVIDKYFEKNNRFNKN